MFNQSGNKQLFVELSGKTEAEIAIAIDLPGATRAEIIQALLSRGLIQSEIGDLLCLSRQRISQIVRAAPALAATAAQNSTRGVKNAKPGVDYKKKRLAKEHPYETDPNWHSISEKAMMLSVQLGKRVTAAEFVFKTVEECGGDKVAAAKNLHVTRMAIEYYYRKAGKTTSLREDTLDLHEA